MGWGFGRGGCGGWLLTAHPDVLRAQLGLTEAQVAQIQPVRASLQQKIIQQQAAIDQLQLQLQNLYDQDAPDQGKVLELNRKMRSLRGQTAEERIKAGLKVMQLLTHQQRAMVRTQCPGMGLARGTGRGWGGGGWGCRGSGRGGWGRGGGWGGGWDGRW